MAIKFVVILVALALFEQVSSHGMMLTPSNRASLWRINKNSPKNENDDAFDCGGLETQWNKNGGKCGTCGDNWASPVPRSNENTGKFGNGLVSKTYLSGSAIDVSVKLTVNHLGTFSYSLCVLKNPTKPETEDCFVDLKLADGSSVYTVNANDSTISNKVQLPSGLTCKHCVLRWHYKCGNSVGKCEDGIQKKGCGNQVTFRSCADISIV
ncbi:Chitin bind 3 domain containing protein [Asbolus verrucosus]|uniref:Chitin bind 3 domain containing protein n=1 Tax=Asbolus verrucosus TaxID=1661398 RepID=A0A482VBW9_ASBVE|nr:Chitin bind 3 domain containing protein [Asbolus verrucosus]